MVTGEPENKKQVKVAIDLMSGDFGFKEILPAVLSALEKHPHLTVFGVGDKEKLLPLVEKEPYFMKGRLLLHHASEVVEMDEQPQSALRNKKDSSMRVAINLVKDGKAEACLSAGNTGALMATARFVLKMLPGIDRPAVCTAIPSKRKKGHIHVLDLGANVDTTAEHLYQFAVMGSLLSSAVDQEKKYQESLPKVALLNIGSEEIKGNEQVREAAKLLEDSNLNYCGFIEPDKLFFHDVDVAVCDGFVGNIALKTMEGTAKLLTTELRESFNKNILTRLMGVLSLPVLREMRAKLNPQKYNGAGLLGLKGIVVKSHGNANQFAFSNAIDVTVKLVEESILEKIQAHFDQGGPLKKEDT